MKPLKVTAIVFASLFVLFFICRYQSAREARQRRIEYEKESEKPFVFKQEFAARIEAIKQRGIERQLEINEHFAQQRREYEQRQREDYQFKRLMHERELDRLNQIQAARILAPPMIGPVTSDTTVNNYTTVNDYNQIYVPRRHGYGY